MGDHSDLAVTQQDLLNACLTNPKIEAYQRLISKDSVIIESLWEAPKAYLLWLAQQTTKKHLLVITEDGVENQLLTDLAFFLDREPIHFPAWETLPGEERGTSAEIIGERFAALKKIRENKSLNVIVTSIKGAFEKVVEPNSLDELFFQTTVGDHISLAAYQMKLAQMGYLEVSIVSEKGQFATRGGIVDLFPSAGHAPYRVEFSADEIISIRTYNPGSQLTTGRVTTFVITPSDERRFLQMKEKEGVLLDYLGDDLIIVFDGIFNLEESFTILGLHKPHPFFLSKEEFFTLTHHLQKIYFCQDRLEKLSEVKIIEGAHLTFEAFSNTLEAHRIYIPFFPLKTRFGHYEVTDNSHDNRLLHEMVSSDVTIFFVGNTASDWEFIKSSIEGIAVHATLYQIKGILSSSFFLSETNLALVSTAEFTHRLARQKKQTPYVSPAAPVEHFSLEVGESVVHMHSGIGRYIGIERRKNHLGVDTEFLIVEYAESAKLYVPIEQAHLVNKYIGAASERPDLHTLGSTRWKNTLQKSEQAILDYAADLIELEASRVESKGFAFPQDSPLMRQFEEEFPYQETPDQLKAIEDVLADMKKARCMDRLVCGDVGYGKTEVAMRAAFKAVIDGDKQVAILVPTTILAMQHFETFSARMSGFAIKIALLSRFVSAKEIAKTREGLLEGTIDMVVGTHRLVSKDIVFKNLGLIIIDEEQRFGVKTKDHLKQIKKDVDCLTLSATPIPRTLYLSLVGARDMSIINTPPLDRQPIATTIAENNDEIIRSAILRELSRDGQVFAIHNRIETIFEFATRIRQLIPEAKIAVAHGQMSAAELDSIFHAFKTKKASILVSTAIIENGIDIADANTILVDNADHFGLADLYQIRGRVGRSHRKAFCYLLVRNLSRLSDVSRRRLSAIGSTLGFGGGMKIAMFDLEIRGAGNLLGVAQSGHVTSIGFTLYCKLLKRAISKLKEKKMPLGLAEVKIDFPFDARLPDDYVNDLNLRLDLYGRLGEIEQESEIDALKEEIIDRFGPLPIQTEWLLSLSRLRLFATQNRLIQIKMGKVSLEAEQSHGPKEKIVKKILFNPIKSPSEIERVIASLKDNFPLIQSN